MSALDVWSVKLARLLGPFLVLAHQTYHVKMIMSTPLISVANKIYPLSHFSDNALDHL